MTTPALTASEAVYNLVRRIPAGKVLTYGAVARELGLKTPRHVGWILHRNPSNSQTPCHRVVFADGSLSGQFAFGGANAQRRLLLSEGVVFVGERVDLGKSLWR